MANDMTVASTTDEMVDVEAAADVTQAELEAGRAAPEPRERDEETDQDRDENYDRAGKAGFQKRIDRLTRERYQNRERIQQLEARLHEVESSSNSSRTPESESSDEAPTLESDRTPSNHAQRQPTENVPEPEDNRSRDAQQVHA